MVCKGVSGEKWQDGRIRALKCPTKLVSNDVRCFQSSNMWGWGFWWFDWRLNQSTLTVKEIRRFSDERRKKAV